MIFKVILSKEDIEEFIDSHVTDGAGTLRLAKDFKPIEIEFYIQ